MPEPDLGSKKLSHSFFDEDGALKEPKTVCLKSSSNRCTQTEMRQHFISTSSSSSVYNSILAGRPFQSMLLALVQFGSRTLEMIRTVLGVSL